MSAVCEYCSNQANYYSSNIDSFTGEKFDIYFCNHRLLNLVFMECCKAY